jgi:hypothetical protein
MSAPLLPLAKAAPLVGCRDPRTCRKRIVALGVPVVTLGGRRYVLEADVVCALRAHGRPLDPDAPSRPTGIRLADGERLWDSARPTSGAAT